MKVLDRESLLKKEELKVVKVDLGNKEIVYVRQMTGRERDQFEQLFLRKVKKAGKIDYEQTLDDFRAKLAVNTLCDEKGVKILNPADYSTLSENMGAIRLMKIADAAGKLNGISEEDKEELVKNSDGVQDDASSSGSAKN